MPCTFTRTHPLSLHTLQLVWRSWERLCASRRRIAPCLPSTSLRLPDKPEKTLTFLPSANCRIPRSSNGGFNRNECRWSIPYSGRRSRCQIGHLKKKSVLSLYFKPSTIFSVSNNHSNTLTRSPILCTIPKRSWRALVIPTPIPSKCFHTSPHPFQQHHDHVFHPPS